KEHWTAGPVSYMGVTMAGFPNLFVGGGWVFSNFPRCAEVTGEFVSGCIGYARENGFRRIETTPSAEAGWGEHTRELTAKMLRSDVRSWFFGNNIPGKTDVFLFYAGGVTRYRKKCEEVAAGNYDGITFT
ncbi:MAG: cyclohexanone monooxygenase, partial [Rhodospirillaceae bacterium]|nr:cyclohexanone monooxygenase [Rhodospirillaceae bacterium]